MFVSEDSTSEAKSVMRGVSEGVPLTVRQRRLVAKLSLHSLHHTRPECNEMQRMQRNAVLNTWPYRLATACSLLREPASAEYNTKRPSMREKMARVGRCLSDLMRR